MSFNIILHTIVAAVFLFIWVAAWFILANCNRETADDLTSK